MVTATIPALVVGVTRGIGGAINGSIATTKTTSSVRSAIDWNSAASWFVMQRQNSKSCIKR